MASLLEASGAVLEKVRIQMFRGDTFYAVIKLRSDDDIREVDAQPSDALALALRTESPYAAEEDLGIAGVALPADVDMGSV